MYQIKALSRPFFSKIEFNLIRQKKSVGILCAHHLYVVQKKIIRKEIF